MVNNMNTLTNERLEELREAALNRANSYTTAPEVRRVGAEKAEIIERLLAAEAKLTKSKQKAKNFEQVAHGLSCEVDALKAQLAELGKQDPVAWRIFRETLIGGGYWDLYNDNPLCSGGSPLYANPVPPAASQLERDVSAVVGLLEEHEWAEHCTKTELGQRLEHAITQPHNEHGEASQPYAVPDAVTPEDVRWMLSQSDHDDGAKCRIEHSEEIGAKMWNACRAAMLQPNHSGDVADKVNSPVIPDGWVKGKFAYDTLFNAIGKAVNIQGDALSISVKAFEDSMIAAAPQHKGE